MGNQENERKKKRKKALVWLIVATILHFAGILLFNSGFFLTRVELRNKSTCTNFPNVSGKDETESQEYGVCWVQPVFRRAVVIVIDALRYDFAAWDDSKSEKNKPFENKMPAIRDLLLHRPMHSLLVPFYADPPTTTMQRLKGMVTGGLPTFMEIKDDVASSGVEITEDNFVDLLVNDGARNITFMGDDTWTALFPNQFSRSFPFPSFNVKDLHTVDDGVLKHLVPEMNRSDWSFIVAHFLGVDHCGHRFGPDNQEMKNKLLQMNQAIDDVVRTMDTGDMHDTVLLVFGDHGMTEDGNHGGATDEEVGAALFVYSPRPILLGGMHWHDRSTSESEHANLVKDMKRELNLLHPDERDKGKTTSGTSGNEEKEQSRFLLGRRPSVQQIDLAPTLALLLGLPIPFGSLGSIVPELFFVSDDDTSRSGKQSSWVARYEKLNQAMERNVGQVLRYLRVYSETAGANQGVPITVLEDLIEKAEEAVSQLDAVRGRFNKREIDEEAFAAAHQQAYESLRHVLRESSESGRALWTQFNLEKMGFGFLLALLGVVLLFFQIPLENDSMLLNGSACLAVLLHMLARLSNSYIVAEARVNAFLSVTLAMASVLECLRNSRDFRPVALNLVSMVCSRVAVELGPFQWFRGQEALPGDFSMPWFWVCCLIPIACLGVVLTKAVSCIGSASQWLVAIQLALTASHWTLQTMPPGIQASLSFLRLSQPRLVYFCACWGIWLALSRRRPSWRQCCVFCCAFLTPAFLLILGPASVLVVSLFFLQAWCLNELGETHSSPFLAVSWSVMSVTYFFATGHESSFNKLHYASPFVGFDEFEYYRGGLMMGSNTFGIFLFCALLLTAMGDRLDRLETLVLVFVQSQALRSVVMIAFVAAQRRHLMVWAIFAPKYVFDAVTLLVVDILCVCLLLSHP